MSIRQLGLMGSLAISCALGACGSDSTADARPADARVPDGGPDAPTFSGTIAIHDVQVLADNGTVNAPLGHGPKIDISFSQKGVPVVESSGDLNAGIPNSSFYRDITVPAMHPDDVDGGKVTITVKQANGSAGPAVPDCTFQSATKTYQCIGKQGTGGSAAAAANNAGMGILTFTDASGATTFGADQVGRYLIVVAGTHAGAAFPILGASAGNQLALINAAAIAPPFDVGNYIIAAGIGPVPATSGVDGSGLGAPPKFLDDDYTVGIDYAGGSGIAAFNTGATPITPGQHVKLDAATEGILDTTGGKTGLNLATTTDVTFGIDVANSGAAVGTIVFIEASDATNAGPNDLGTNGRYRGSLTVAAFAPTVVVKKEHLNVLGHMNPKKLRISVFREGFAQPPGLNVVVGHGVVKFQTLP
jgi:hypothetical protein